MDKISIEIDLNEDFDAINLEIAIAQSSGQARNILIIIYNKWMEIIGKPEWKKVIPL